MIIKTFLKIFSFSKALIKTERVSGNNSELNTKEKSLRKRERKMMGSLGFLHTPALGSLPLSSSKVTHFVYSNHVLLKFAKMGA